MNYEYNRVALRQYLSDILALECSKQKLYNTYNQIDKRINSLGNPHIIKVPKKEYSLFGRAFLVIYPIFTLICYTITSDIVEDPVGVAKIILLPLMLVYGVFLTIGIVAHVISNSAYKEELENYNVSKAMDKQRVEQENLQKAQLIRIQNQIAEEWEDADRILNRAYSANIIPVQFRNIYAVYYLNQFISSSNESFTTALLHCDLDEIKRQLSKIIEQNQQMIINQAVMMSQNQQLFQQNNQQLRRLAQVETNTELSAKYSQIAAVNAEACAWIGVANYLKD